MILRMITLNSLGAFAQEVGRRPAVDALQGAARPFEPTARAAPGLDPISASPPQRPLEAAPSGPPPVRPLPRGSLLDLRV